MAIHLETRHLVGSLLLLSAAAWPCAMGALGRLILSPTEELLRAAWCGVAPHSSFTLLGHCAACWAGSAILGAAAAFLLAPRFVKELARR